MQISKKTEGKLGWADKLTPCWLLRADVFTAAFQRIPQAPDIQ